LLNLLLQSIGTEALTAVSDSAITGALYQRANFKGGVI